jgi:TonB family protein
VRRRLAGILGCLLLSVPASGHDVTCDSSVDDLCGHWNHGVHSNVDTSVEWMDGTVTVDLEIDPTGHVSDCQVVVSSAEPRLDRATCDQLAAFAHYQPALDDDGRPAIGSDILTITWVHYPVPQPKKD